MATELEVLLADDDDVGRYVVATMLQRAGFVVRGVADGLQAVDEARRRAPDLIVLDVQMPHLNGFDACRRLKADPLTQHVPVLMLSATFIGTEYQVEGLEGGADGYLTQPIEAPVLAATVRALIRARRAETAVRDAARQWRATFDAIDDAVVLLDADGVVRQANVALARLAGTQRDVLLGRVVGEVLPGLPGALAQLAGPEAADEAELEVAGRVLRVRATPVDVSGEAGVERAVTLVDVTRARRLEQDRALQLAREQTISRTLQQALVPARLTGIPGVELDAWHLAAETELVVGGDWYDAIETPDALWLVIGDVAGHGVQAAAQASQLRHSLRVYATEGASLTEALHAVNGLVAEAGAPDFVTLCAAAVARDGRSAEVANAGHPPPVLVRRGRPPRLCASGRNTALGLPGTTFSASELELEPGDRLLLYTDGLVERRGETLDAGLDRLLGWTVGTGALADTSRALRDAIVAHGPLADDVAVLAAQVG